MWTETAKIVMVLALGMLAVYVLLPRPRRVTPLIGAAAAAGALLLAGLTLLRITNLSVEVVLFLIFSTIAVVAGGLLITQSNPVHAALSFALVVLSTCGLFLLQAAPFLMAATIIVYAGAIVVTFLFVIMLAQQTGPSDADQRSREPFLATFAGFILLGSLLYVLQAQYEPRGAPAGRDPSERAPLEPMLQARLDRIERAMEKDRVTEIEAALGHDQFFDDFQHVASHGRTDVDRAAIARLLFNMQSHWESWEAENNVAAVRRALTELAQTSRTLLIDHHGSLQPRRTRPLSAFSGTPANEPFHKMDRDQAGFATMPAENTAYLGKSLFTDYLLAVELAGTLLLVAAIGTIAIASRRAEGLR